MAVANNLYLYGFPAGYSCSLSVGGMGVLLQPNKVVAQPKSMKSESHKEWERGSEESEEKEKKFVLPILFVE